MASQKSGSVARRYIFAVVARRPRLLTHNGESYISGNLAAWLEAEGIDHVSGTSNHTQMQGRIGLWHQTNKNRILLENYCLADALKEAIAAFVEHYNHQRHHESLGNLTPADVNFGRAESILRQQRQIKTHTSAEPLPHNHRIERKNPAAAGSGGRFRGGRFGRVRHLHVPECLGLRPQAFEDAI